MGVKSSFYVDSGAVVEELANPDELLAQIQEETEESAANAAAAQTAAATATAAADSIGDAVSNAEGFANAAEAAATAAALSETNAAASEDTATTQASIATTKATEAAASATAAAGSASSASTDATSASASATAAASSASDAAASATAAEDAADRAEAAAGDVTSVFTRTGAVVAESGDYEASLVTNDSSVTGATVKDALETLAGSVGGGAVDSVNGQTGTVVLSADDISDSTTTHKFTTASDISKLAAIEASADVTDAGNVGSSIHGTTAKTTLADNDEFALIDSAASNVLKRITWANVYAAIWLVLGSIIAGGTGKSTPVDTDTLVLADSAASNATKKLTWANVKATIWSSWGALIAAGTTKSTPVDGDSLAIADSAASSATKQLTWANLKATLKTYNDGLYAVLGRTISAGSGLTGGGDLSANRTISDDINGQTTDSSPDLAADYVKTWDASASAFKKVLLNKIGGGSGQPIPTSSTDFQIGSVLFLKYLSGSAIANGSTVAGSSLNIATSSGANNLAATGASLSGTWKNITGTSQDPGTSGATLGYWVRTA